MKSFKGFVTENDDVAATLKKLPAAYRELVKGYKFLFEPHNTLSGDDGHVGMVTDRPKVIRVAAPWRYSREFTVLHEIGHLVYEKYIRGKDLEKRWSRLALSTKDRKKDEPAEELWCHAFADTYAKHKIVIHHHAEWEKFVKSVEP